MRLASTYLGVTQGERTSDKKQAPVDEEVQKVLRALDDVCMLDPASFATVYRSLLEEDKERAEAFFQQILEKTGENGMLFLYQMAVNGHCKVGDLEGLQRRRDEALLRGIRLPVSVHSAILGLLKAKSEADAAIMFVRELREEGTPLCSGGALEYVRTLVAHSRCSALAEFLQDLRDESITLHNVHWPKLVLSIIASLLSLPGHVGDVAVDLGRSAYALCSKLEGVPKSAGDEAKCYKRLMELFMTHHAPTDAAAMVVAFLRVQTESGFDGPSLGGVVKTHLSKMTTDLISKGKLDVAMSLAENLCNAQGNGGPLPYALPSVARHILYHLRYVKDKGPEVAPFLIDTILPALLKLRVRGYERTELVDKCFFNALCIAHSLPSEFSYRVLEIALEHYQGKTVSSRVLKTLLCSASHAPALQQGLDAVDTMASLRWTFYWHRARVGLSHMTYIHLSPEQMETANRRCFLHFYPEALELIAKTRHLASRNTVRFMLHLLRQLEEHGIADLPSHVALLEQSSDGPIGRFKKRPRRKRDISDPLGSELRLRPSDDPLPHMVKPPGVSAWDYRNVLVVARELGYLEACVYAVGMAQSRKLLDTTIALMPVQYQDIQAYLADATKKTPGL